MNRAMARLRARVNGEAGFSILELVIATFAFGIVSVVFTTTVISVQNTVDRETTRSIANDQARVAIDELDRQIRSGNILYDPLLDDAAGLHLRIYTQSNGEPFRCVEWRISGGALQHRERLPNNPDPVPWPGWSTVATSIVNGQVVPPVKAFQIDTSKDKGSRTLDVTLLMNATPSNASTQVTLTDAITGRNTSYGYPTSVCDPFPPD